MPKGTPDQGLPELDFTERLVAVNFRPVASRKGRMYAVEPTIIREPVARTGARPSVSSLVVDGFGRKFGGNHKTKEAAARINRPDKQSPVEPEFPGFGFFDDEW